MRNFLSIRSLLLLSGVTASALASADFVRVITATGTGIGGAALSARATLTFTDATDTLTILLENEALLAIAEQGNSLSGFYWSAFGNPTINKVSVALGAGSNVTLFNVVQAPASYNLNDEWAYRSNITTYTPNSTLNYGISAVGVGIFGGSDTFSGAGGSPDGTAFDIIPNAGVTGGDGTPTRKYVNDSALFTFNTTASLNASDFRDFAFQYGSGLNEPSLLVPEPASMAALAVGAVALLRRRRRV